jgi:hypothetical protein
MSSRVRLEPAIDRLRRSRLFIKPFLADLRPEDWYWSPSQITTHVAWQVGHLAVAQYNMCLRRIRGRTTGDEALISDGFIDAFKAGSKPEAEASKDLPLVEIQRVFNGVHDQALAELADRDDAELDVPLEQPHPAFKTKLAAVEFCALHEMVHAGQIALLRRLMGKPPLR